jgi:hypothetical protein
MGVCARSTRTMKQGPFDARILRPARPRLLCRELRKERESNGEEDESSSRKA